MTKKTHTKTKKARIIYEEKTKQNNWVPIGISALLIILIGIALISNGTFFVFDDPLWKTTQKSNDVLVSVNGEAIYADELDAQWDALPLEVKQSMSRSAVLDGMVEERVLLQEAAKKNITITDAEVEAFLQEQIALLGITPEVFTQYLQAQNTTLAELIPLYKTQLTIQKLFENEINTTSTVSDEEIEAYYETYKEDFVQEEMVTVRHILIEINDNFNKTQAEKRVAEILGLLNDDFSNFCELVSNYSVDLGSADTCGEYTFAKGQFNNPAFENPAFAMDVDEVQVINTSFGLHIMLKTDHLPKKQLQLNDTVAVLNDKPLLKTLITEALQQEKTQQASANYIRSLLEQSDIEYYVAGAQSALATDENATPSTTS